MARPEPPPSAGRAGRILGITDYDGPVREVADYVIVGSGPAGATLAKYLVESGQRVILVEAGAATAPKDFVPDIGLTLARHFWEGGTRATHGNVVLPTLQARTVGGGSVFNAAICMRPTQSATESWVDTYGLDCFAHGGMEEHYQAVWEQAGVKHCDESVFARRNELFRDACSGLGWDWEPMPRFEEGCVGSGECITGCRAGAKQSMDKRAIRDFVEAGGTVMSCVEVDKLILHQGRAKGVVGQVVDPTTYERRYPVRIQAKCTILAAGTIGSPVILRKSGLTREAIGSNLTFHPSCLVFGVFDEAVDPWNGATQGVHCTHWLEQGIKLESLWSTTSTFAMRLPKSPRQFGRYLKKFDHVAVWDGWISGEASKGKVRVLPGGKVDLSYNIGPADVRRLAETNALLCDMYAQVGAKEVLLGVRGLPTIMDPEDAARELRRGDFEASDMSTGSNHVMGATPMGLDPKAGAVCDSWGKVYDLEDCYVCDTGLYPSSPGVNPQFTAMALARRLGLELPNRY